MAQAPVSLDQLACSVNVPWKSDIGRTTRLAGCDPGALVGVFLAVVAAAGLLVQPPAGY